MLKCLIVDDEERIRKGLQSIINWEEEGFIICGEAANGEEALQKIDMLQPDLVIIDMKMPLMNGLEVIEVGYKAKAKQKFIILSGYSDFQYAQKAIWFGVEAYLLKPINEQELLQYARQIRQDILLAREESSCIQQSAILSKEKMLEKYVTSQLGIDQCLQLAAFYQLDLSWKQYQIVLIELGEKNTKHWYHILPYLKQWAKKQKYGYVFPIGERIALLTHFIFSHKNKSLLEDLQQKVQQGFCIDLRIALGMKVYSLEEIDESYQEAAILLQRKFLYPLHTIIIERGQTVVCEEELANKKVEGIDLINTLYMAIDVQDTNSINDMLEDMMTYMEMRSYSEDHIKAQYIHIYTSVIHCLIQANQDMDPKSFINESIFDDIYKQTTLRQLHGYVKYKLMSLSEELKLLRPEKPMEKILDYIQRNLSKEIRLEQLAQVFHYSSAYLGKQFRQHAGENFNAYLERVRMEESKKLLGENLKVYEVAERVGYKDVDYFGMKFKRHTGLSPSQYRKKHLRHI